MKRIILLAWPLASALAVILILTGMPVYGQSLIPVTPLTVLPLEPTIKVIKSPEIKKQAAVVPAQAASAVVVIPATPIK